MNHPVRQMQEKLRSLVTPNQNDDVASARRVLQTEIEGLQALAKALDQTFSDAISKIHEMKQTGRGRLIVAGIGKSGHVAKKITATMASTGTPSYFVHPGEASHGDLGMISTDDVVLLLSNSGENPELTDMIAFTRRFAIPLIGMTSNPKSALAKHADIPLVMPKMPEACPNGLAPTTSTTMMLALGDALAVALIERMGLTADEFRVFHPGGKLGAKLRKVSDLMLRDADLPLIAPDQKMGAALAVMTEKNLGSIIVADADMQLRGIITDGDLKRHITANTGNLHEQPVTAIMTARPKTIPSDALLAEAVEIMVNRHGQPITSLVVVDDKNQVKGLIRMQECLKAGVA